MRKVLCAALIILLLNGGCCLPVFAEGLTFQTNVESDGSKIVYSVTIPENSEICGLSLTLYYDPDQIELQGFETGSILDSALVKCNGEIPGKFLMTLATMQPILSAGRLVDVRFSFLDTESETAVIRCEIDECLGVDCLDLSFVIQETGEIRNPGYERDGVPKVASLEEEMRSATDDWPPKVKDNPSNSDQANEDPMQVSAEQKTTTANGTSSGDTGKVSDRFPGNNPFSDIWIFGAVLSLLLVLTVIYIVLKNRRNSK